MDYLAKFLVGIVFLLLLPFIIAIAISSTMTVWAVVNHLDLDRLPVNFPHYWCGRWLAEPAHDAIHHPHYAFH